MRKEFLWVEDSFSFKKIISSYLPLILIGVGLLGLFAGLKYYTSRYEEKAEALLLSQDLKKVVEDYPRSPQAITAGLTLGKEALDKKNYDEAIRYYQKITDRSEAAPLFRLNALQNLALAYLKKGELDQAISLLQKASEDKQNAIPGYSKLLLAYAHESKGDMAKAREIYKNLSEEASTSYSLSALQAEAKERLEWLDSKEKK